MKKLLPLILVALLSINLCSCSQNNSVQQSDTSVIKSTTETTNDTIDNTNQSNTSVVKGGALNSTDGAVQENKAKKIYIGKTIHTENYDFTLKKVELSYDVMPDNPPSYYNHYPAEDNQVYIHVDTDIKNTSKRNLECDEIYSVTANYDDGYTYDGFAIVEDTDGDFTYANITDVTPLQTLGVHTLVDCPEEIETSKKSLRLVIKMSDDSQYEYVIRK